MKKSLQFILVILVIPLMFLIGCAPGQAPFSKSAVLTVEPGKCSGDDRVVTYTVKNTTPSGLGSSLYLPYLVVNTYDASGKKVQKTAVILKASAGSRSYSNKDVLPCSITKLLIWGWSGGGVGYQTLLYGIEGAVFSIN